jgi:hypothetical protein
VELLFALSIPGLAVALVACAAGERLANRVMPARRRRPSRTSSAGFDVMHSALAPGSEHAIERKRVEHFLRDDEESGAPSPRDVDLRRNVAKIKPPPGRRTRGHEENESS